MIQSKPSAFDTIFKPILAMCTVPVIHLIVAAAVALPMYILWNAIAPIYFTFLPAAWLSFTWKSMWAMIFIIYTIRYFITDGK